MSLFDHHYGDPRYPRSPGAKEETTSRAAAESMKPTAAKLREQCLRALSEFGPMTADEVGVRVGITPFSARPRISELLALGRIEDTGERWANASGRSAKVWRAI